MHLARKGKVITGAPPRMGLLPLAPAHVRAHVDAVRGAAKVPNLLLSQLLIIREKKP